MFRFAALSTVLYGFVSSDDIPGCACPLSVCRETESEPELPIESLYRSSSVAACSLLTLPTGEIDGIFDDLSLPICDAIEGSNDFQEQAGPNAPTVDYVVGGPYYSTSGVTWAVGSGTCDDIYAKENSCGSEDFNTTTQNVAWFLIDPKGCASTTTRDLAVTVRCRSFTDNTLTPPEDSLDVYIENEFVEGSPCDGNNFSPKLTSNTWIEPESGRRYMCYETTILSQEGSEVLHVMVMSIGNEPCKGPEESVGDDDDDDDDDNNGDDSGIPAFGGRTPLVLVLFASTVMLVMICW